jgi:nickel/cobalt exporter
MNRRSRRCPSRILSKRRGRSVPAAAPRRTSTSALLAGTLLLLALLAPTGAHAHPLGNFSVNHLSIVSVSTDRVDVRWILDQAEIPTYQERGRTPTEVLAAKRDEALRGLRLRVDGSKVALAPASPGRISFPAGQGGLRTTRVELLLRAPIHDARRVTLRDETFGDRYGWRAIIAAAGDGTATRSSLPATEPTGRLHRYPVTLLSSPADERSITLTVRPGEGQLVAPTADRDGLQTTGDRANDGFAGLFADAAAGKGTLVLLLLAAFGWGALHALSPGHGKAMVAAYLVGARGTPRHAILLGATVTVTHTIGVFALGIVTLALSQYLLPEDLYPWLNLVAGLLVLLVGATVLRARMRRSPNHHHDHDHHHHHHHHHHHEDDEDGPHAHDRTSHSHGHGHGHSHHAPDSLRPRALLAAGAAAGLIPCPSALVVLLGAIAQHEIALGLLLIVMFSLGLAATLTALGIAVVSVRGLQRRWQPDGRFAHALAAAPAISAVLIVALGCLLTARAIPTVI